MAEVEEAAEVDRSDAAAVPISVAARRVGLSVDTLRVWQRRYGLGPSRTSAGGHRRYEEDDLRRLRAAVHLLRSGVRRARRPARSSPRPRASPAPRSWTGARGRPPTSVRARSNWPPPPSTWTVRACAGCWRRNWPPTVWSATWEGLLRPLLAAIGEQWRRVPYTVAVEHLVSHVATATLAAHVESTAERGRAGARPSCWPASRTRSTSSR